MMTPTESDWREFLNMCYEEYLIDMWIEENVDDIDDDDVWWIIE